MTEPKGARVIRACESMCEELRRRIGLTAIHIELDRPTTPLMISLRSPGAVAPADRRHDPRAPARIEIDVSDDGQRVATVRIEDAHHAEYLPEARAASQRIVAGYARQLSILLRSGA